MNSETGESGINAFLHIHGHDFAWPTEPWQLPDTDPGVQVWDHVDVRPGGNRVRSYLDVAMPNRALEMAELRRVVDPATATWRQSKRAAAER